MYKDVNGNIIKEGDILGFYQENGTFVDCLKVTDLGDMWGQEPLNEHRYSRACYSNLYIKHVT